MEYTRVYKEYSAKWAKDTTDFELQNVLYPMNKTCHPVKLFCQVSKNVLHRFQVLRTKLSINKL